MGAHHTRAWTSAKEIEQGANWTAEEKVDLVIYRQSLRPLFDMLGVCRLPWIELGLNEQHYAVFYECVTGKMIDPVRVDRLLDLYYQKRGWNADGVPPAEVAQAFADV